MLGEKKLSSKYKVDSKGGLFGGPTEGDAVELPRTKKVSKRMIEALCKSGLSPADLRQSGNVSDGCVFDVVDENGDCYNVEIVASTLTDEEEDLYGDA